MSGGRTVRLPETNTGALLSEVTRAFMHGACPSAAIARLSAGMLAASQEMRGEDNAFLIEVAALLDTLHTEVRALEDARYEGKK